MGKFIKIMSNTEPPELTPEEIQERIDAQNELNAVDAAIEYEKIEEEKYASQTSLVIAPKNRDGYITIGDRNAVTGVPEKRAIMPNDKAYIDSSGTLRKLRSARYYIVDKLFTAQRVHMLAGPSGVNKTTWLLPMIKEWSEGKDVLGYKSNPVPYMYVSCDRPLDGVGEVLERLELQDWKICCQSLGSIRKEFNLGSTRKLTIKDFTELYPQIKVFFIEGIGTLKVSSHNPNDYAENMQYWSEIGHMCEDRDVTIFGVTHCAKAKPGEKYDNPRDQVIGSVGLPASTDTIMIMQFDESKDVTNRGRKLYVIPRNVAPFVMRFKLGEKGGLESVTEEEFQENETRIKKIHKQDLASNSRRTMILDSFLLLWQDKPGTFTMKEVVAYAEANGSSQPAAYRWKDDKIASKELIELKSGHYRPSKLN